MADILFFRCYQQECLSSKFNLSIFLIIEECVGLPAVVWALRVLYRHYKSGSRVSAFMISLLLSDLLMLLLNPYIVTKLPWNHSCWYRDMTCRVLPSLWSGSIICGLHLQQMVALEGALFLRHPFCSEYAFFPSCSIIISIIIFICFFLCELFSVTAFILFGLPFLIIMIMISWIISCRPLPCISDTPYRIRKPSFTVLAFVTFTVVLYGTLISACFIIYFIRRLFGDLFILTVFILSLNVIMDPLLCVLVCRKHTEIIKSEVNI